MLQSNYFDEILNLINEGILLSDRNGIQLYVNKTYEEFTGVSRESMIGKTAMQMREQGFFDVILNPEVVRTQKTASRVQTLRNGLKVMLNAHPIFDEKGDVALVVTFVRDVTILSNLEQKAQTQQELLRTFQEMHSAEALEQFATPVIINSDSMQSFFSRLTNAAKSDATILLLGETGTGKDVFARKAYVNSLRSGSIFIKVDCSSIPENLIETELFGYMPGTFSGASSKGKIGLIEAASLGTLFLDEIGELPLQMQSRLLRVLQDKEIVRVGAVQPTKVDVRFIVATNKDLQKEVEAGNFRSDLYYRLNVCVFTIPPLRSRKDDILPLARAFLTRYGKRYKRSVSFSPEAERALREYTWPGNVRELENLMHRLVVGSDKYILEPDDMPFIGHDLKKEAPEDKQQATVTLMRGSSLKDMMAKHEAALLRAAVKRCSSMAELCCLLKIDRTTVTRKLHRYGIGMAGKK